MTTRFDFLRATAASPLAARLAATPAAGSRDASPERLNAALVLSGGGARGAYEAGTVAALVRTAGISDGVPLPGVDAVVGTSIGSLNAYLVATAQYRRLADLWHTIGSADLFRFEKRYRSIVDPMSGLLNRVYEGLALERGLVTNVRGMLDRDRVAAFIENLSAGPAMPLVPLLFTATNLSAQHAEIFYRGPAPISASRASAGEAALRNVLGHDARAWPVEPGAIASALLASTAIPILFDPVELSYGGTTSQYIDGGIADNTPVDVARTLAKNVYAVLVDPPLAQHVTYPNALTIGFASFGVAQRRILDASLRAAVLESEGKRLFADGANAAQRSFLSQVFDSEIFVVRPSSEIELAFADFSSQARIDAAYDRGFTDGLAGWKRYGRDDASTPAPAPAT